MCLEKDDACAADDVEAVSVVNLPKLSVPSINLGVVEPEHVAGVSTQTERLTGELELFALVGALDHDQTRHGTPRVRLSPVSRWQRGLTGYESRHALQYWGCGLRDRKSRLNSSHTVISYAVFCLKKKKNKNIIEQ